jgi:UDP-3-O-[3-hydroxymyristoyl] N-acetylglucosamine deacetylase/3-hydroxyacyl-[acyl-carrier-protein] dehydratase
MNVKQRTIKAPVSVSGTGLHTGESVTMTFNPAPEKHGYKFRRIDLPGQPIIDADVDNVTDTSRGTTLTQNGASVSTVEHVLAALVGLEIDNVLIDMDGPETPIMDGSSIQFIDAIEEIGFTEQEADREYYHIPYNIHYSEPDRKVDMVAMPLMMITALPVWLIITRRYWAASMQPYQAIAEFKKEIASSRTFCFLHELEALLKHDLIKGGDLNNAIVVVDKKLTRKNLPIWPKCLTVRISALPHRGS